MCCLFGLHNYSGSLSRKQKEKILSVLSAACEERGTDATGIAYHSAGRLSVYKRPWPAHLMRFRITGDTRVIMGHTRMATQGDERKNRNNHPFAGRAGATAFALAHNGVLRNDTFLRKKWNLPKTRIETDSYVAVQLLERRKELSFRSLRHMAEQLEGSFTFTVLSEKNELYFIKGDNPMCIFHYPERGLYLYASTESILKKALKQLPYYLGKPARVNLYSGEILRIDAQGICSRSQFDDTSLLHTPWLPWTYDEPVRTKEDDLEELKSVAAYYGLPPEDVDELLGSGFSTDDIEEMLYCRCTAR